MGAKKMILHLALHYFSRRFGVAPIFWLIQLFMLEINQLVATCPPPTTPLQRRSIACTFKLITESSVIPNQQRSSIALAIATRFCADRLLAHHCPKIFSKPHYHPSIKIFSKKAASLKEQHASAEKNWLAMLVSEVYVSAN